MKKTFLLLVLFLIGISFFEAKAQPCPSGYTYVEYLTTYIIIDPDTGDPVECIIGITYCFKIETNGDISLILRSWGVTEPCWSNYDFNNSAFKDWIREKMIEHFNTFNNPNPIACPNHENVMLLKLGGCWGSVYEPNPAGGGTHRFIFFGLESYCLYEYEVCIDYNFTPPKTNTTLISSTQFGEPDCDPGPIVIGGNGCKLFCN